jgi:D-alanyl-D-alanine carboxypeptidase
MGGAPARWDAGLMTIAKNPRWVLAAGLAGIAALAAPALAAAKTPQPTTKLQRALDRVVAAGAPGAVLTVRHGKRVVHLASGLSDLEQRRAMRPDDRVRIASLTKSYVSTVVLQVVQDGKLHVGDSVEKWLPGVVPNGAAISIRMLLNHTSGLADFEKDPQVLAPYLAGDLGHAWTPRQLVDVAMQQPPVAAPGGPYSYSNTNYVLLGMIVEAATGRSIGAELQQRIFDPLRLHRTTFETSPEILGAHAHGYTVFGEPPLFDITGLYPYSGASGAIVSTTREVARFYRALLTGRLLPDRLLRRMQTTIPAVGGDFEGQTAGFGLQRFPLRCGEPWGHNGDLPGFYSLAFTSSNGRHQSILVTNADAATLPDAGRKAYLNALIGGFCRGR